MNEKPLVIATRGDTERAPENTLPAFASAMRRGADGVELDVHLTRDGVPVVHHFYNLGSTDDGEGLVGEHTLAELQALDAGGWFGESFTGESKPALRDALQLCRGKVRLEVDVKDPRPACVEAVLREIEQFDLLADVELTTAHYPLLPAIKKLNPDVQTGTFFLEPPLWMPVRLAQQHALAWAALLEVDVVHLHGALITADFVEQLRRCGLRVHGSNLDTAVAMRRGLAQGIDGFSTGSLSMALAVREEFVGPGGRVAGSASSASG